jgi:hypothetical protein
MGARLQPMQPRETGYIRRQGSSLDGRRCRTGESWKLARPHVGGDRGGACTLAASLTALRTHRLIFGGKSVVACLAVAS